MPLARWLPTRLHQGRNPNPESVKFTLGSVPWCIGVSFRSGCHPNLVRTECGLGWPPWCQKCNLRSGLRPQWLPLVEKHVFHQGIDPAYKARDLKKGTYPDPSVLHLWLGLLPELLCVLFLDRFGLGRYPNRSAPFLRFRLRDKKTNGITNPMWEFVFRHVFLY